MIQTFLNFPCISRISKFLVEPPLSKKLVNCIILWITAETGASFIVFFSIHYRTNVIHMMMPKRRTEFSQTFFYITCYMFSIMWGGSLGESCVVVIRKLKSTYSSGKIQVPSPPSVALLWVPLHRRPGMHGSMLLQRAFSFCQERGNNEL